MSENKDPGLEGTVDDLDEEVKLTDEEFAEIEAEGLRNLRNVTPINRSVLRGGKVDRVKKPAEEEEKIPGLSKAIHLLTSSMRGDVVQLPSFPKKFHVMEDFRGEMVFFEEEPGQVLRPVNQARLENVLMKYVVDSGFAQGTVKIMPEHVKKVIRFFAATSKPIQEPSMVKELSDPGYCYKRLPFDIPVTATMDQCPTFAEIMSRTSNASAFMQWIGSIFDPRSDMRQYVWLYGDGQNSKSRLGWLLAQILGSGAAFRSPPKQTDRFWMHTIVGKRLVIFGDCNNAGFVTSGEFKSLTGGDEVQVEIKNGPTYSMAMGAKFLFFSNKRPNIDSGDADQSRVIFCRIGAIGVSPIATAVYNAKLLDEAPFILGLCRHEYRTNCPEGTAIKADTSEAEELGRDKDEEFETIFWAHFAPSPKGRVKAIDVMKVARQEGLRSNYQLKQFRDYMERAHGIKRVKTHGGYLNYEGIAYGSPNYPAMERDDSGG